VNLARILRSLEWGVKVGQGGGDEDKVYRSAMPRGAATGRRAPRASRRVCGFWSTFLYHCSTNQTGMEIVRPNFLPITLILIRR
jgi:hypothetical protein